MSREPMQPPPIPAMAGAGAHHPAGYGITRRVRGCLTIAFAALGGTVLVVFAIVAWGAWQLHGPRVEVTNMTSKPDVRMVNGEMDAGLVVKFHVKNVGDAGPIFIEPWLTSSEGEWKREQRLEFDTGQSMDLEYFFHEPTINAANMQYGVRSHK